MKRTFLLNHIVAWSAAVIFAWASAIVLVTMPASAVLWNPARALPLMVIPSILALLFLWRLAVILGPYDLLAFLPGGLAVVLSFGLSYANDLSVFLPDDGHTMFDVIGAGAKPFDFWGQFQIFSVMFVWVVAMVWGGIAFKRWRETLPDARKSASVQIRPSPKETRRVRGWLALDLGVMVCVTFAVLYVQAVDRIAQGKPEYLIQTLLSSTSSTSEKLKAIWELTMVDKDDSGQVALGLRRAAREQQPPISVAAAALLLERNDISVLPALEKTLMQAHTEGTVPSSLGYIKDPKAIPILGHLMTSQDVEIRRETALTLANIGTETAIDPLMTGLYDADVEVRYNSVCGLAKICGEAKNQQWWPNRGLYGQNEAYYLNYWKALKGQPAQTKP